MSSGELADRRLEQVEAPGRGRRYTAWALIAIALVGAAGAAAWFAFRHDSGSGSASAATGVSATTLATVGRRNLASTETFDGTLGYVDVRTVLAQSQGTITALVPEGSIRMRGQVLYRVDNAPTVLLYGSVPVWRALSSGVADGPDVRELEQNLVALGYDPNHYITVDNHFTGSTAAAVDLWQAKLGLTQTGTVPLGAVVFLRGPRRIGQQATSVGASLQPGAPVLTTSATGQEVVVQLDATNQTLAVVGHAVNVDLPDGSSVPGRISAVGKVAQAAASSSAATGGGAASASATSTSTIEVDISLLRRPREALDQAPVSVDLTTESRPNVLAVPVIALVALLGGGYAVEVAQGTTTRLVAVTPGLYAGGYVEITRGVREGERVVVPQ